MRYLENCERLFLSLGTICSRTRLLKGAFSAVSECTSISKTYSSSAVSYATSGILITPVTSSPLLTIVPATSSFSTRSNNVTSFPLRCETETSPSELTTLATRAVAAEDSADIPTRFSSKYDFAQAVQSLFVQCLHAISVIFLLMDHNWNVPVARIVFAHFEGSVRKELIPSATQKLRGISLRNAGLPTQNRFSPQSN